MYSEMGKCIKDHSGALLSAIELFNGAPYIDFHFDSSADDFTSRIIESTRGNLDFQCGDVRRNGKSLVDWQQLNKEFEAHLLPSRVVNTAYGHGITLGYDNDNGLYAIVDETKIKISATIVN